LLLGALLVSNAYAADDDWMVRVRAVDVDLQDTNVAGVGTVSVRDKVIPEADVSYFFTPNIAAELVLTYPQKHDIKLNRATIGSVKELPPTLLLQYHFLPGGTFNPYVGAGINYTNFSSVRLPTGLSLDSSSVGGALQAGVDIPIADNVVFNVDVKKIWMSTDLKAGGSKLATLNLDPVLVGVGVGWRF
jgi:outer membrane protein